MSAPARIRGKPPKSFRRRVVRGLVACGALMLLLAVAVTGFIVVRCYGSAPGAGPVSPPPPGIGGYHRSEAFTFLTLPEWLIVFSADEYASYVSEHSPSGFPFVRSAVQYWSFYGAVCDATQGVYPFETGYHVMLGVIGASQTIEYGIKAVYEGTLGRFTAWLFTADTPEDRFGAAVAAEYGAFMHNTPWYQFPFFARLRALWSEVPAWGPHPARKWERRAALTAEFAFKGVYGWLMGRGSQAAYGAEDLTTYVRIAGASPAAIAAADGRVIAADPQVIALPRYEGFTPAAIALAQGGARFLDVAGNDTMLLTFLVPSHRARLDLPPDAGVVVRQSLASDASRDRVAMSFPVGELGNVLLHLARSGVTVEHLYDY